MPLAITFPESLPVSTRRDEIARAVREHPVVIVSGETGSGKTTQLPKIALAMGRGRANGGGLIGHTQPRRIAARRGSRGSATTPAPRRSAMNARTDSGASSPVSGLN